MYLANLDINHDLYAGGIRKNQDHPYLYGVVLTFLRGKIAKVGAEQTSLLDLLCRDASYLRRQSTIAKVEGRGKSPG